MEMQEATSPAVSVRTEVALLINFIFERVPLIFNSNLGLLTALQQEWQIGFTSTVYCVWVVIASVGLDHFSRKIQRQHLSFSKAGMRSMLDYQCLLCAPHWLCWLWNPEQDTDSTVRIIATDCSSEIWKNRSALYCQNRRKQCDWSSGEVTTSYFITHVWKEEEDDISYTSLDSLQNIFLLIILFAPHKGSLINASTPTSKKGNWGVGRQNYPLTVQLQRGHRIEWLLEALICLFMFISYFFHQIVGAWTLEFDCSSSNILPH